MRKASDFARARLAGCGADNLVLSVSRLFAVVAVLAVHGRDEGVLSAVSSLSVTLAALLAFDMFG